MNIVNNVFVRACSIPYKFSSAPCAPLQAMHVRAAREVIEKSGVDPALIKSVFIGTMGGFTVTPSEMGANVCSELGLEPYRISQEMDTSSTGASALFNAFQEVAFGPTEETYVLVIAGEQMYPEHPDGVPRPEKVKQAIKAQSLKNTAVISGVIGSDDRRYGLSMPLVGDMLERDLMEESAFPPEQWMKTIFPSMRKAKLERGKAFTKGHFHGKEFSYDKFMECPMITPLYARDTMVPQSSGVVAVLLTNQRPEPVNGKVMRIRSMGQGFVSPLITRRRGPLLFPEAIYRALLQLCQRGGLCPEDLRAASCRFDHDAFKAIERTMGFVLGFGEAEVIDKILEGYNNPFGGLEICGHAIGASGLLHVAQAFSMVTHDPSSVDPEALPPSFSEVKTIVCSSVGAALTNLFFSFLEVYGEGDEIDGENRFDREKFDAFLPKEKIFADYEEKVASLGLGPEDGIVLTYTVPNRNLLEFGAEFDVWVNLVQMRDRKVLALSRKELCIGDRVRVDGHGFPARIDKRYARRDRHENPLAINSFRLAKATSREAGRVLKRCRKILED